MANNKPDIWTLLCRRFPSEQYALLPEVRDKAGHYASNSADGIAFNLWPSRGLAVEGIEIKSFRSDWLREFKNPKKAENIFKYCDYFWLVTIDDTIAKLDEIPYTWGWLAARGNKLCTMKEAPKLTPEPLTRHIIAAMLKRATKGMIPVSSIQDEINKATDAAIEYNKTALERANESLLRKYQELSKEVREFETAAGIKLSTWMHKPSNIGNLVRFLQENGKTGIQKDLTFLQNTINGLSERMAKTLKEIQDYDSGENS